MARAWSKSKTDARGGKSSNTLHQASPTGFFYLGGLKRLLLFTIIFVTVVSSAFAYTVDQLANAIYKAENSKSHPYGILTHYKTTTPRQACINTIKHAVKDWDGRSDFIVFLGSRYCPVGATNDPTGLNKNWVRNVKMFLKNDNQTALLAQGE